jgi:hypothetical protein
MPEETLLLTPPPEAKGLLAPDKEIDLLIKSIEEASKHTKDTLLVLLAASFYILEEAKAASINQEFDPAYKPFDLKEEARIALANQPPDINPDLW